MKKRSLILLLTLIFLLNCVIITTSVYAQAPDPNPFAQADKARMDSIKAAKSDFSPESKFTSQSLNVGFESGDRYIVQFTDAASMSMIYDAISQYRYEILGASTAKTFLVDGATKAALEQNSASLIKTVESDSVKTLSAIPNDEFYGYQWNLSAIQMPSAWSSTKGSTNVLVAVIDSGLNRNHPDLKSGNIKAGKDFYTGGACNYDYVGHGTAVTSVIGATTNNTIGMASVSWTTSVLPLNVSNPLGDIYDSMVIAAIYMAADSNSDVINMSFVGSYDSAENAAVQYAVSKGVIVVAGAGNDAESTLLYPASYENVISVGSVDPNLNVSFFSQYNNKIDVTAPGENIVVAIDAEVYYNDEYDYAYADGTSFSSPQVAAVAGLARSLNDTITVQQFFEIIKNTCDDRGDEGYDVYYGYGILNANAVMQYVINNLETADPSASPSPTPTIVPTLEPTPTPTIAPTPTPTIAPTPTPTIAPTPPPAPVFNDLGNYPWAAQQIIYLASRGIINGVGNNMFMPGANITRADFLILVVKSLNLQATFTTNFNDVYPTDYFYNYVGIARKLGLVSGVGDNVFNPRTPITRQEMFCLVARALRYAGKLNVTGNINDLANFTDKDQIASYAVNDIAALVKDGFVKGSNNMLNPLNNTTRAEAAVLIYKVYTK